MAEAEFRAKFRFSCWYNIYNISANPSSDLMFDVWESDLCGERSELLLIDGSLIDGVGNRQVDQFTATSVSRKTRWSSELMPLNAENNDL